MKTPESGHCRQASLENFLAVYRFFGHRSIMPVINSAPRIDYKIYKKRVTSSAPATKLYTSVKRKRI